MTKSVISEHVELAQAAGFTKAAARADEDFKLGTKLMRANGSFQSITQVQIDTFNADLRKESEKIKLGVTTWKALVFVPIADYPTLPPLEVMHAVKSARELEIFDTFEVAYIADQQKRRDPDPIVFGRVKDCGDRFFVSQWGEDVKIADLLVPGK